MNSILDPGGVVELAQLQQSRSIDGVPVSIRCFWVKSPSPHYELHLSAGDETGIIDVPLDRECCLDAEIEECALCFATSFRLRSRFRT